MQLLGNVLDYDMPKQGLVQYFITSYDRTKPAREWVFWLVVLFGIFYSDFVYFTVHYCSLRVFDFVHDSDTYSGQCYGEQE